MIKEQINEIFRKFELDCQAFLERATISKASGSDLDHCAECYSVRRAPGKWYWPFKESDKKLRRRLMSILREPTGAR